MESMLAGLWGRRYGKPEMEAPAGESVAVRPGGGLLTPSAAARRTRAEAVIDFVMFFYEKIRTEAGVVEKLNQALKERYGTGRA